jgi:hypothetical protein
MKKHFFCLILLALSNLIAAQNPNPLVIGKTRFTIITPELIRMEYATDGQFIDNQTLFACNRSAFSPDFQIKQEGTHYTITTKRMVVKYINSKKNNTGIGV